MLVPFAVKAMAAHFGLRIRIRDPPLQLKPCVVSDERILRRLTSTSSSFSFEQPKLYTLDSALSQKICAPKLVLSVWLP